MIKITVWALPHTKWRHYMEIITRNEKILYIGIDVHKDTYSLCSFDFFRNELSDEMTVKATTKAVIKYLEAIKKKHKEEILFACGYEAGPTGYGLCRGLQKAGYGCVVMAPTTMSNPDGKRRVKTDIIDARAIARILAYKSYSQVHLPSEEMEALKEYTRARDTKKRMFKKAKQDLYFFRIGFFEFHYFKEVFFLFFIFLVFMIKKITKKNNLIKTIQISLCYGQRN